MGTNDLLIDAFTRIQDVVHDTVEDLDEDGLTYRPSDDANSIAWLVWHLARIQDDHIADVAKHEQVWIADGWYDKFDLPFDKESTGYGHDSSDVAQITSSSELLLGYYDAVHDKTIKFIKTLNEKDYDKIVDKRWDPPVTLAVRIVSVISDDLQHAGQAAYIRGLL
jgi:hypothetical protein